MRPVQTALSPALSHALSLKFTALIHPLRDPHFSTTMKRNHSYYHTQVDDDLQTKCTDEPPHHVLSPLDGRRVTLVIEGQTRWHGRINAHAASNDRGCRYLFTCHAISCGFNLRCSLIKGVIRDLSKDLSKLAANSEVEALTHTSASALIDTNTPRSHAPL
jgi:hypothetical protein